MKHVVINTHRSFAEATLEQMQLHAAGINAQVHGEQRPGLQGLVGLNESRVEVRVAIADAPRARDVLNTPRNEGERRCEACGERSPAAFDQCWQCQATLVGEAIRGDAPPSSPAGASSAPVREGFPSLLALRQWVLRLGGK